MEIVWPMMASPYVNPQNARPPTKLHGHSLWCACVRRPGRWASDICMLSIWAATRSGRREGVVIRLSIAAFDCTQTCTHVHTSVQTQFNILQSARDPGRSDSQLKSAGSTRAHSADTNGILMSSSVCMRRKPGLAFGRPPLTRPDVIVHADRRPLRRCATPIITVIQCPYLGPVQR